MWALVAADPVPAADARRRRRLLRPAHPLVHAPLEGARPHRHAGRAQGPAERAEEPVRPPARARHHVRLDQGVDDAVGPDPLRRDVPVLRRRVRDRARGGGCAVGPAVRRPGSRAPRCAPSRRCRPTATRCCRWAASSAPRTCTGRPASPTRAARSTASRCTCRSRGSSRCGSRTSASPTPGEGWRMVEDGVTQMDGDLPVNMSAACCRPTRSAHRACCGSPRRPCRSEARPASTRSTAPRSRLGHAYGGGSQFFAMWVVGADKP